VTSGGLLAGGRVEQLACLALATVAVALTSAPSTLDRRGDAVRAEARAFPELPLATRAAIARVLGRDESAYQARPASAGFTLRNPRHGLEAHFAARGVEVHAGSARLGFALRAAGYGEALQGVERVTPTAQANQVEYHRGVLTEWYANGPLGLEQGFTLAAPPVPRVGQPLTLALTLSGTLASVLAGRDGLTFAGSSLRYRGLMAADAAGRSLPAWLELRGRTLLVPPSTGRLPPARRSGRSPACRSPSRRT
jgi:hypothetical protein